MSDVFISYSRTDKEFVRKLHDALAKLNRDTWVDWEGIPLTAEWLKEIYAGIEAADNFVFVISPESLASTTCQAEIAHAIANNKRLIPIMHRSVPDNVIPQALAKINFIFFHDSDDFGSTFKSLIDAIDTDLELKQAHTRLLIRAKEWERSGRDKSYLLRGKDLREAEDWQARGTRQEPNPTALHSEYILTSRRTELQRQRITLGSVVVALLVAIGLAIAALIQRNTARREATIAQARQLAAQAESLRTQGPAFIYPAIALALESISRESSPSAAVVLRRSMSSWRLLSEVTAGERVDVVAFSPDGRLLASGNGKAGIVEVSEVTTGRQLATLIQKPFLEIMSLAFSPDGRWLAICGSKDGTVSIWDSTTGKQLPSLEHGPLVTSLAFSPDSQWLVTGGADGSARVWHVGEWTEVTRLRHDLSVSEPITVDAIQKAYVSRMTTELRAIQGGPSGFKPPKIAGDQLEQLEAHVVSTVAFSKDEQQFATWSDGGTVVLWNVGTWKSLARFRHEPSGIATFSPDLKRLAFVRGRACEMVSVRNVGTEELVSTLAHQSCVKKVAFSPDGSRLGTADRDGAVHVWDAPSGKELWKPEQRKGSELTSLTFSPDSSEVVAGGQDNTARIFSSGSGREWGSLPHQGFVMSVTFSPDGRRLATGSWDGRARVWEPPASTARLRGGTAGPSAVFSPDRQYLAGVDLADQFVRVWETATGKKTAQFHSEIGSFSFSPDGRWLGGRTIDGKLSVWDLKQGTMIFETQLGTLGDFGSTAVFSPDSRWVASGGSDGTLRVFEAATGNEKVQVQHKGKVTVSSVAFSLDGRLLASSSFDGTAVVAESASGKIIASLPHGEKLGRVLFSPDGRWLATMPELPGEHAWLWETGTGKLVVRLSSESGDLFGGLTDLEFSSDSRWLAAVGGDKARVWDTSTGTQIAPLQHRAPVFRVAFSPGNHRLATAVQDGTVAIWQFEGGKQVAQFRHADQVNSVLFSPDGHWVASASKDGTARVWEPDTGQEIMRAEHGEDVNSVAFTNDSRFLAAAGESTVGLHPLRPEDLTRQACSALSRNLSPNEWRLYLQDIPYRRTCPQLP